MDMGPIHSGIYQKGLFSNRLNETLNILIAALIIPHDDMDRISISFGSRGFLMIGFVYPISTDIPKEQLILVIIKIHREQ